MSGPQATVDAPHVSPNGMWNEVQTRLRYLKAAPLRHDDAALEDSSNAGVYGWVWWLLTLSVYVAYIGWVFTPVAWLQAVGLTYLPDHYWAAAIPAWVGVSMVFLPIFYMSLNLARTPPLCSMNTVVDQHASRGNLVAHSVNGYDVAQLRREPVPMLADMSLAQVSHLLYADADHEWRMGRPVPEGSVDGGGA